MSRVSYRKFQIGDEDSINNLYYAVTGIERSVKEFHWQWLNAPGGEGEIWLIEYLHDNGDKQLIGHHGLMPLYFSFGSIDLLAGKTENTMVLSEYRRKILYPKFEKLFLASYSDRFDLLFSTVGPPAPLRQRKALGYSADENWINFSWSVFTGAFFARLEFVTALRQKKTLPLYFARMLVKLIIKISKFVGRSKIANPPNFKKTVLTSEKAITHKFFETFWDNARHQYGITPRRNKEDLQWRFWQNPHGCHITIIIDLPDEQNAYVILRKKTNLIYEIEDLVCSCPTATNYNNLICDIGAWVADQGGMVMNFTTCSDDPVMIEAFRTVKYENILDYYPFRNRLTKIPMLRKVSSKSPNSQDLSVDNWFVTRFVYEGR